MEDVIALRDDMPSPLDIGISSTSRHFGTRESLRQQIFAPEFFKNLNAMPVLTPKHVPSINTEIMEQDEPKSRKVIQNQTTLVTEIFSNQEKESSSPTENKSDTQKKTLGFKRSTNTLMGENIKRGTTNVKEEDDYVKSLKDEISKLRGVIRAQAAFEKQRKEDDAST